MEDSIPHGCRLIDLNELRNGLKSCQVCKSGEKIPDILFSSGLAKLYFCTAENKQNKCFLYYYYYYYYCIFCFEDKIELIPKIGNVH